MKAFAIACCDEVFDSPMPTQPISPYKPSYAPLQDDSVKQRTSQLLTVRPVRNLRIRFHRRKNRPSHVVLVGFVAVFILVTILAKTREYSTHQLEPIAQVDSAQNLQPILSQEIEVSLAELQMQGTQLFATSDSLGTIAIGVAEGTRTPEGRKTLSWEYHSDPGNGAINQGTFSWQMGAATPEEADLKGLTRIQKEAIPYLIQVAEQEQISFDLEMLLQGADLWNQAPEAGANFVQNLKQCLDETQTVDEAVLCARVESFYNPITGELDASGFDNDRDRLENDQRRRMQAIKTVFEFHDQANFSFKKRELTGSNKASASES